MSDGKGGETAPSLQTSKATEQFHLDLSAYAPDYRDIGNTKLEGSAGNYLLRVFLGDSIGFMVARPKEKTLTHLKINLSTQQEFVHLGPGARIVLVQEINKAFEPPVTTDRIAILDGQSGAVLRVISDPHFRKFRFLTISPNGKAIYFLDDQYWFYNLAVPATDDSVTKELSGAFDSFFFADR